MSEAKLQKIKIKRNTLIGQQHRVKEFVDNKLGTASVQEVQIRLEALEKYYTDFQNVQAVIEEYDTSDPADNIRAIYEELYFLLRATLMTALSNFKHETGDESINQSTANTSLKLPKIQLPTFYGEYTQWLSYYETFSALVHRNAALDNVTRFHYLLSSLQGGALKRIQSIEVTPDNYDVALKLLVERYQKRNIIVREHIKHLLNLPSIASKTTATTLRDLIDTVSIHLRALTSLGRPVAHWDDLIVEIILSKLDNFTLEKWNNECPTERFPTLDELLKFLEKRCNHLEDMPPVRNQYSTAAQKSSAKPPRTSFVASENSKPIRKCTYCDGTNHLIYRCHQFLALTAKQRFDAIHERNLCNNCLKVGHTHQSCSSDKCRNCNKLHHTLLHDNTFYLNAPTASISNTSLTALNQTSSAQSVPPYVQGVAISNSLIAANSSTIILATALIKVVTKWGASMLCRSLLDSASQLNFVSERLAVQLGLRRRHALTEINGIGDTHTSVRHFITITIKSRTSSYTAQLDFHVLPRISAHQPEFNLDISRWNLPGDIQLADPAFYNSQKIDILLGAETFFDMLLCEQRRLTENLPMLQSTRLGWIVSGRFVVESKSSLQCTKPSNPSIASLELLLRQFWEIEAYTTPTKGLTAEEKLCETHFISTVKRSETGRFIVKLPFRQSPTALGDSFYMARRRLLSIERRFIKDRTLFQQYSEFMKEYENLNHMTRLEDEQGISVTNKYFLPHHCVVKNDSSTTKLRVVFDASSKTSTNLSLNDILMTGPTLQSDLFSVITRFRTYRYVFTTDISKMYRQIEVDDTDRSYQMILWRDKPQSPIQFFKLNTVTYGTSAAPYLATRCLTKLAEDEKDRFPAASLALLKETYVDDIMTGANTLHEAASLLAEIQNLLGTAQFELRKYCSNHPQLLKDIPEEHKEPLLKISGNEVVKTLGLIWHPTADTFTYNFNLKSPTTATKRTVLSDLGSIFDPLGLIGPVVVLGKIFMQQICKLQLTWDAPLPEDYGHRWSSYVQQLKSLNSLQAPRHLLSPEATKSFQIHSFSDSSETAYGACCYLRSIGDDDKITVRLICSKSRVAPLKSTELAKLELQAALLMAELVDRLLNIFPFTISQRFFYTDSKIVLAWIAKPSYTWTTFVANRVAKVQELTRMEEWHYINTKENPADFISRGMLPETFLKSSLWQFGPEFLLESETILPQRPKLDDMMDVPERRPNKLVLHAAKPEYTDLTSAANHRQSLHILERIFAYCIRFKNNTKVAKGMRTHGPLTNLEINAALQGLIRNAQRCYLSADFKSLSNNKEINKKSKIKSLDPFLDSDGLIRVGGRLHNSNLEYRSKHQIVLPKSCNLTKILVFSYHFKHLHAGPQTLHSILRQQYWPIGGKNLCRDIVHRCIRCFRTKPTKQDPFMGSLPKERVQPGRAFLTTGIDFCGPVPVHSQIRGRAPNKAYLAIFVCFSTRAVHIEVVSDLSTAAFIAALRRFIARRGLCSTILSDNATNFIGAKNELRQLWLSEAHQSTMRDICQQDRIEWRTIPPRSPHFGGLWEAAVKQAKHHLTRVVASATLSFEELSTITAQIEAILNSRPLTPLSSDPSDLGALTPGHFLIGEPLTSFPEPDITDANYNRLSRFRRLQQLQQVFWRRWSRDYLHLLQQRYKWKSKTSTLQPGMLVLIQDENLPPYKWPLGRIISTISGKDGVHRIAELKTQTGIYQRAITRLYPLPIDD